MKKFILLFLIITASLSIFPQTLTTVESLDKYLIQKDNEYEAICREIGKETWDLYSGEDTSDILSPKNALTKFLKDKSFLENIRFWKNNPLLSDNSLLQRKIDVWNNIIEGAEVDSDPQILEKSVKLLSDIRNRNEDDKEKNAELERRVLELISLRNTKARELGFDNYADYILEHSGAGAKWLYNLTDLLLERTEPALNELKEKAIQEKGSDSIKYLFRYFKRNYEAFLNEDTTFALMKHTANDIGYVYDSLPIRFIIKEADFGGNCIGVDIPGDFRVIMVPGMPVSVYLHELGHGDHQMFCKINSGVLEAYEWSLGNNEFLYFEGMAEVMAYFSRQPEWYKKYLGFDDEKVSKILVKDKYAAALNIRYNIYWYLTEIELYRQEGKDPNEIHNDVYKKVFQTDENPRQTLNLVETSFVDYPCYRQNYLCADIIGVQVHKKLREVFGDGYTTNKEVAPFLVKHFSVNGILNNWRTNLKNATGSEFDIEGYLSSCGF